MATLPPAGYPSDDARTEADMKNYAEDILQFVKDRLGGGSTEYLNIVSGVVTPQASLVAVTSEGGAGVPDDLVAINTGNVSEGHMLLLFVGAASGDVTLKHMAANIDLRGGTDRTLSADDYCTLLLLGGIWFEVYTYYEDPAKNRELLGLGNAATYDTGAGNGLDADTVDGLEAAAFQLAGQPAADSDALGTFPAAEYARLTATALQTFLSGARFTGVLRSDGTGATDEPEIRLEVNQAQQVVLRYDRNSDRFSCLVYESTGTTVIAGFRIDGTQKEFDWYDGSSWNNVFSGSARGLGSNIDSEFFQGQSPSDFLRLQDLQIGSQSGNINSGDAQDLTLNRRSFFPSLTVRSGETLFWTADRTSGGADLDSPKIRMSAGSDVQYDALWEYF